MKPTITPVTTSGLAVLRAAVQPGRPLHALTSNKRFIVYLLEPKADQPGKYHKRPINWQTGHLHALTDETIQTDVGTAIAAAEMFGVGFGVGYVFHETDKRWFLDIDNCIANGQVSPLAISLMTTLQGAYMEYSASGRGIHVIGSGAVPPHSCKNKALQIELYHHDRFCALTGQGAIGAAGADLGFQIAHVAKEYFPAGAMDMPFDPTRWTDFHVDELEDPALLEVALRSAGLRAIAGHAVMFRDLWLGTRDVLQRHWPDPDRACGYDQSSADAALASHLVFYTGGDCARVKRLLLQSPGLRRDKWFEHKSYLDRTVLFAAGKHTGDYYKHARTSAPPVVTVSADWNDAGLDPRNDVEVMRAFYKEQLGRAGREVSARKIWERETNAMMRAYLDASGVLQRDELEEDVVYALLKVSGDCCVATLRLLKSGVPLARPEWDQPGFLEEVIRRKYIERSRRNEVVPGVVGAQDFVCNLPGNDYINLRTGARWERAAVIRQLGEERTAQVDRERKIHCLTWDPLMPPFIKDRVVREGTDGWVDAPGQITMNTFSPSTAVAGDASQAGPWLDQVRRLYPQEWRLIVAYFAHLVQKPGVKINHALVLGGAPRIGKDSICAGPRVAVGLHNCAEINAGQIFDTFTPWTKCLLLRINESYDTGDANRFQVYERMKQYLASPPESVIYNNKNVKAYPIRNAFGTVVTTNHPAGGVFLPPDDRRHLVCWSDAVESDFTEQQWIDWWRWFDTGGDSHVVALLRSYDIGSWNPKAPPPRTPAWHVMVGGSVSDGDADLAGAIETLGSPEVLTVDMILNSTPQGSDLWCELNDRKKSAAVPKRLAAAGYLQLPNPHRTDRRWKIGGREMNVYRRKNVPEGHALNAVKMLQANPPAERPRVIQT